MVSPSEGNEARRKRRRESHISIVPLKQGSLDRGEGKEDVRQGTVGGKAVGGFEHGKRLNVTPTDSKRESESLTGRTGCLNWARPDLWELWGVIPRATRPDSQI